jgi:hypothetical protein
MPSGPWPHQQLREAAGELAMPAVIAVATTLLHL